MVYISKKRRQYIIEQKLKRIFFRLFLPIAIIFILIIFFLNASFMEVKGVEVVGDKYVKKENIEKIVQDIFSEKYFGIYNKNNFLFYPETDIENKILESEKRIKNIDISYLKYNQLKIEIEEKTPEFLFCYSSDVCNFVEKSGDIFTVFDAEKTEKSKVDFITFKDLFFGYDSVDEQLELEESLEVIKDLEEYDFVFDEDEFEKVTFLLENFENYNLIIKKVVRNSDGNFVFYTKSNKKILIKYNQDFEKIISTLKTLSQKKLFRVDKFKKDFNSDLVYIDLSYNDYIFYCQKGSECEKNYTYK